MDSIVLNSKKLAFLLRHSGMTDSEGFVSIDVAIKFCDIDRESLLRVVDNDNKNRFELMGDRIRARYGHSDKKVNPGLKIETPTSILYHGTTDNLIGCIMEEGLKPKSRIFVHLSEDSKSAIEAATRHRGGKPILLEINALEMHNAGFVFYQASNGIWNVAGVPPLYIISKR